jgi:hypothetical protein
MKWILGCWFQFRILLSGCHPGRIFWEIRDKPFFDGSFKNSGFLLRFFKAA